MTGDYSSQGFVAHASGSQLYVRSADPVIIDESADISFVMKSRAARNFGSPPSTTLEGNPENRASLFLLQCNSQNITGLLQMTDKSSCSAPNNDQ